jgi:glycosyltransferase involved in cell wall biosynthesis
MNSNRAPRIWLIKAGEPLPTEEKPRLLRTGVMAERLVASGWDVTWWTPTFDHRRKAQRPEPAGLHQVTERYRVALLESSDYRRNISVARIRSLRRSSRSFARLAAKELPPDVIVASYPFTELCTATMNYAAAHDIPFVLDIRDPFPDNVSSVVPLHIRLAAWFPVKYYRRKLRRLVNYSAGVTGVSDGMLDWALGYADRVGRRPTDQVFQIGADSLDPPRVFDLPDQFTPESPLVCLFICSGGQSVDGRTVLEAFRILEERGEARIRCYFTGEGERHAEWREAVPDPGLVEFTGHVTTRMVELLRQSHVGIVSMTGFLPRFWLGNKFFEYLSASMVMVSNAPGSSAMILNDHALGYTIPMDDPVAMADTLQQLAGDPGTVAAIMHHVAREFPSHFERDAVYGRFIEYLRGLAGGHG